MKEKDSCSGGGCDKGFLVVGGGDLFDRLFNPCDEALECFCLSR